MAAKQELPREIMVDILHRLPAVCLMKFKCVCKAWQSLISDPEFAKAHLERSTRVDPAGAHQKLLFNTDVSIGRYHECWDDRDDEDFVELDQPAEVGGKDLHVVGSCNGLLCLYTVAAASSERGVYVLWNPTTNESRELPDPPFLYFRSSASICFGGFGYDPSTDDYKILLEEHYTNNNNGVGRCRAEIFSLRTNSWKMVEIEGIGLVESAGTYFNGSLHWLLSDVAGTNELDSDSDSIGRIISFNFTMERFQTAIPMPCFRPPHRSIGLARLTTSGGRLILYVSMGLQISYVVLHIWRMEEYSSAGCGTSTGPSWTKLEEFVYRGDQTAVAPRAAATVSYLVWSDARRRPLLSYNIPDEKKSYFNHLTNYIESLVSPASFIPMQ